jgi:Flp pilus assembly protein TadD
MPKINTSKGMIYLHCGRMAISLLLILFLLNACSLLLTAESTETTNQVRDDNNRQGQTVEMGMDPITVADYQQALADILTGNHAQAKSTLLELTRSHPTLAGPQINLGILLLVEEDMQGAEHAFRTALQHNPSNVVAYNQLGLLLRRLGRFSDAEQAYSQALLHDPDYLLAHRNIGILYDLYLQQPSKALHHYQRCQSLTESADKEITNWIIDLQQRRPMEIP